MIETIIKCDVCGKTKGEVNHWWLVWANSDGMWIEPFRLTEGDRNPKHICGQECAVKAFSEWMAQQIKQG